MTTRRIDEIVVGERHRRGDMAGMNAAQIAHALGDAHREGRAWRCRCPVHVGLSLRHRP